MRRKDEAFDLILEAVLAAKAARLGGEEYCLNNRTDAYLRALMEIDIPERNDCGYLGRFELEGVERMLGNGPPEGAGMCDFPWMCPQRKECPFGKEVDRPFRRPQARQKGRNFRSMGRLLALVKASEK